MKNIDSYIVEKLVISTHVQPTRNHEIWDKNANNKLYSVLYEIKPNNTRKLYIRKIIVKLISKNRKTIDYNYGTSTWDATYTLDKIFTNDNLYCEHITKNKTGEFKYVLMSIDDGKKFIKKLFSLSSETYHKELINIFDTVEDKNIVDESVELQNKEKLENLLDWYDD